MWKYDVAMQNIFFLQKWLYIDFFATLSWQACTDD